MNREDYEDYEDLEENEDFEENEDYEDSYEDEEYDDDEEYDEDEEYDGLSAEELELIATDYSKSISEDPIEELSFLLDRYFKIQKLDPQEDEEVELKAYATDVIRAIVMDYDIPTDDLGYLFRFVLTLESYYEKNRRDIIFNEVDSQEDQKTLKLRVDEYLADYPDLFDDPEVYSILFDIEGPLTQVPTYKKILEKFLILLAGLGTVEAFDFVVELYAKKVQSVDQYLEKMEVPSDSAESLAAAFEALVNSSRKGSLIQKKIEEAKALITQKYPEDQHLKSLLPTQNNKEIAKKYKYVKFGSLAVCVVAVLINFILGLVLIAAWVALFFSPLHDKVPFLVEGKKALTNK